MASMRERLEQFENEVNDEINKLRRQEAAYLSGEDMEWENHPKVKELAHRLAVAREHVGKVIGGKQVAGRSMKAAEPVDEAPPGAPEASPGLHAATRPDVLSSPYAGSEPRYARQYMTVPGGEIRPDPIERVKPDPESEAAGAVSPEEADYMAEGGPSAVLADVGKETQSDAPRPVSRPAQDDNRAKK